MKSNELALYSRVHEEHGEVNVLAIVLGLTCGCLLLSGVATTYFCKRSDFFLAYFGWFAGYFFKLRM